MILQVVGTSPTQRIIGPSIKLAIWGPYPCYEVQNPSIGGSNSTSSLQGNPVSKKVRFRDHRSPRLDQCTNRATKATEPWKFNIDTPKKYPYSKENMEIPFEKHVWGIQAGIHVTFPQFNNLITNKKLPWLVKSCQLFEKITCHHISLEVQIPFSRIGVWTPKHVLRILWYFQRWGR